MSDIIDGGQAFPRGQNAYGSCNDGMTLRDYFAAAALTGILSAYGPHAKCDGKGLMISETIFATAYEAADAMLKAREVRP